jgi:hypothetical protein
MIYIGNVRIDIKLLPSDILLGIGTGKGQYMCESCDEWHDMYVIQLGFFFFTISIMW